MGLWIMGERTRILTTQKQSLGHLRAVKRAVLRTEEEESRSCDPSVCLIGYFQDILCKQVNECYVFRT